MTETKAEPERMMPKKPVQVRKVPVNPDCEPATKGYVKCIARTMDAHSGHSHTVPEGKFINNLWGIMFATLFVSVIVLIITWFSGNTILTSSCVSIAILSGLIAVVSLPKYKSATGNSEIFTEYPDEIEKYEPPSECEPKKGC